MVSMAVILSDILSLVNMAKTNKGSLILIIFFVCVCATEPFLALGELHLGN